MWITHSNVVVWSGMPGKGKNQHTRACLSEPPLRLVCVSVGSVAVAMLGVTSGMPMAMTKALRRVRHYPHSQALAQGVGPRDADHSERRLPPVSLQTRKGMVSENTRRATMTNEISVLTHSELDAVSGGATFAVHLSVFGTKIGITVTDTPNGPQDLYRHPLSCRARVATTARCRSNCGYGEMCEAPIGAATQLWRCVLGTTSLLFLARERNFGLPLGPAPCKLVERSGAGHSVNNRFEATGAGPAERECSVGHFL